jgi:adenylate cyclase
MRHLARWFRRLSALRIGLYTGVLFAFLHLAQVASRGVVWERWPAAVRLPLEAMLQQIARTESALRDIKFLEQGRVPHENKVAVVAVDEKAIARYGRWPWDRRILAQLVDVLTADGASAIGFDMAFSDEDYSGQFAGADRFRTRFDEISLATGRRKVAVERFSEAEADLAGSVSALDGLRPRLKPGAEPIYRAARGRLDDGRRKLAEAKEQFGELVKEHAAYAVELERSLNELNADRAFAAAIRRSGKVVIGWEALTPAEADAFSAPQLDEQVRRLGAADLHAPEFRESVDDPRAHPLRRGIGVKHYIGLRAPLPALAEASPSFGFFNAAPDSDGVIRSAILGMEVRGHYLPSLELAAVAMAMKIPLRRVIPLALVPGGEFVAGFDLDGKLFAPTDERGLLRINYYGPDRTDRATFAVDRVMPQYSVADVLADRIPPGALRNQVVLVAATAEGTFDQRNTPFKRYTPGVTIHANAIQTLLDRRFIRTGIGIQMLEVLSALVLGVVFAFLYARVRVGLALPVLLLSAATVHFLSYGFFRLGYEVFEAVPLMEMASMFVLVTVYRYATEERDKRQLRKAFQLYLNPEVMDEMIAQPEKLKLGGDEKELTVLFSDIRDFTSVSEKLSPRALVHLLNGYLTPMTDIIFERRGTLDKYIGDAMMAFFGAPIDDDKHALHCCQAALEMMRQLERLREKWRLEDPSIPALEHGIGINTGRVVVGNMGSSQRFNYTVMGDAVNLASRLEGLNKEYGTQVLISGATLLAARAAAGSEQALAVRELDAVRVKGKTEPVRIFELRGLGEVPEPDRPLLDTYANGLLLYRQRRFNEARVEFETCLSLAPSDGPSRLFTIRCEQMAAAPPGQGWDGVSRVEHK